MARAARVALLLLAFTAPSLAQLNVELEREGATRVEAGVTWREAVHSERTPDCGQSLTGDEPAPCMRHHSAVLRNDSDRRIQCNVALDLSQPAVNGESHFENEIILLPGHASQAIQALAPEYSTASLQTHCGPGTVPPPLEGPPCVFEATLVSPDDYYPPGSVRREETGEAVIEFTIAAGVPRARDIELVVKTGYPDLDSGALRIGRSLRIQTQCPHARVRRAILFDQLEEERPERAGYGNFSRKESTILVTDYVERAR